MTGQSIIKLSGVVWCFPVWSDLCLPKINKENNWWRSNRNVGVQGSLLCMMSKACSDPLWSFGQCSAGKSGVLEFLGCYIDISHLTKQAHLFMATVFPNISGIFHQDNAPCNNTLEWFKEPDKELKVLTWPSKSADFNLIQHISQLILMVWLISVCN